MHRTLWRLLSLGEAEALLENAPTVDNVVRVLQVHTGSEMMCEKAMPVLSALDSSDEASLSIKNAGMETVIDAMRVHVNSQLVKEHCARAIGNMALLSQSEHTEVATTTEGDGEVDSDEEKRNTAQQLVAIGAVELVISLMREPDALTPKGRCWVTSALLNMIMFSREAAQRAVDEDAESVVAELLMDMCKKASELSPSDAQGAMLAGMAVDSSLGIIARLISMQTGEESRLQNRYQLVPQAVVTAVAVAMFHFPEELAVQHKGWEALNLVSQEPKNQGMLFQAIFSVDPRAMLRLTESLISLQQQSSDALPREVTALLDMTLDAALGPLIELTSPRHDLQQNASSSQGASYTVPTESALTVVETLCSGPLSTFVLARVDSLVNAAVRKNPTEVSADIDRITQMLTFLGNASESDVELRNANAVRKLNGILSQHRVLDARALGKVLSCFWNGLNHRDYAPVMAMMDSHSLIRDIVADREEELGEVGKRLVEKLNTTFAHRKLE